MPYSLATLPHRLHRWLGIDRRRPTRDRTVVLDRRRIFILPTGYGLVFAAMTFLMLIGAANYNNSVAFLLTFLLMGMGMVALVRTYRNLAGLRLYPGRCPPVFCGEAARFELIAEDTLVDGRPALTLQADGSDPQWFASEGGARIELAVPTTRRGLRPLGRVTIATRYPLGLFRAFAYANFDQACLVYPRPSSETALPSPRAAGDPGRSGLAPGRDDFLGHRDFVHGDPPRHVDWKAAARTDRLLSKTFGEANQAEWWLDWDDHAGLDAETRLSHLCRGVLLAEASGRPYGLRLPGERFGPDTGSAHRHRCLRALALFADWP